MDHQKLILVIDQGTHASRCILFDYQGRQLMQYVQPVKVFRLSAECIEQDGKELLLSVRSCLHQLPASLLAQTQVCALTGQRSSFLAWHRNTGQAASRILNWQDTRSAPWINGFKNQSSKIRSITGLPLSAHYGAGKIHWLLQQHPELSAWGDYMLGPVMAFLADNLLARPAHVVDHSNAHRSLLFDIHDRQWSRECLDIFSIPTHVLPACCPVEYDYGVLKNTDVPVSIICGDQNAALFSRGRPDRHAAYINVGTGAFILRLVEQPDTQGPLLYGLMYSSSREVIYAQEATVNGAGAALDWLQASMPVAELYEKLDTWLMDVEQLPVFINTIGGLGSPWWSHGEAYFVGNSNRTEACYVAVVESIVFMLFRNLQLMQSMGEVLDRIYISGGLSRLNGLCQRLADLSHLDVYRGMDHEATARGAAWLAADRPRQWHQGDLDKFSAEKNDLLSQRYKVFCHEVQRLK